MSELPIGWKRQTLKDVADVVMGQSPPGSSYNEIGEGVPFFQGKAEFGDVYPTVKKFTTAGTKFAKQGDILMSVRAPVGPTNIAAIDCVIGRGLAAIRAKDSITQDYLKWTLKHLEIEIQGKGKGTTFDSISGDALRETKVLLPPIAEQHQIVEILEDHLSRLDAALVDVMQAETKCKAFVRSLLHQTFVPRNISGKVPLSSICEIKHGFAFSGKLFSGDPNYPTVLTPGNFALGGGFQDSKPKTFCGEVDTNYILNVGDLVVTMTDLSKAGDTLGYPAIIPRSKTYLHNQRIGKVKIKREDLISRDYMQWVLRSNEYREHVLKSAAGTTVRHTSPSRILSFEIELPTKSQQQEIVDRLEMGHFGVDGFKRAIERSQEQAKSLRRSLLQAAFTGQLTRRAVHV